jgi:hypothetical protein
MYLYQVRAVKCFLEKIAMMGNVIGVPQNMEYVFRVQSVIKVENHCIRPCVHVTTTHIQRETMLCIRLMPCCCTVLPYFANKTVVTIC